MTSVVGLVKRVYTALNPPVVAKDASPIRFGILGAANIAPPAFILPAKNHSEVVVAAVAARDKAKVEAYAKKYKIPTVYSGPNGYQELLDNPNIDAIYNPLPNGLHYEWTIKALAAGKHVLLEKPSANTAAETRRMFDLAESKGLVLLEAFHYRFHPAVQRLKEIVDTGELGSVKSLSATLAIPSGQFKDSDIRFNYDLGGGGMMDMGCYVMSVVRYLTSAEPLSVISATAIPHPPDPRVDSGTTAVLAFPADVTADIMCNMRLPGWGPGGVIPSMPRINATVQFEGGSAELFNFVMPTIYHTITVTPKKGKKRVEKVYTSKTGKGEAWWTTYRWQLEAFVDKIKGREPQTWLTAEESIANMQAIETVYEKSGLGSRPASKFELQ